MRTSRRRRPSKMRTVDGLRVRPTSFFSLLRLGPKQTSPHHVCHRPIPRLMAHNLSVRFPCEDRRSAPADIMTRCLGSQRGIGFAARGPAVIHQINSHELPHPSTSGSLLPKRLANRLTCTKYVATPNGWCQATSRLCFAGQASFPYVELMCYRATTCPHLPLSIRFRRPFDETPLAPLP